MRFDNTKYRSLNETITHMNEPQVSMDEYTELLESVLLALCEELQLDPNELVEGFSEQELSEGLRDKIKTGLKIAAAVGALAAGGYGISKSPVINPRDASPASQVERSASAQKAKSTATQSSVSAAAKAKARRRSDTSKSANQAVSGVDNSAWTSGS